MWYPEHLVPRIPQPVEKLRQGWCRWDETTKSIANPAIVRADTHGKSERCAQTRVLPRSLQS